MSFIKNILSKLKKEKKGNDKNKVQQFLNGDINQLTAKDTDPHFKVFEKYEMPHNSTIDDYRSRLANAQKYLPLPAAYKDALKSLRGIIRIKKKANEDFVNDLEELYRYACEYSFFNAEPQLANAQQPAFNMYQFINDDEYNALIFSYMDIGYSKINELKKTDVKWLVDNFGEPNQHFSVPDYYRHYRNLFEQRVINQRKRQEYELTNFLTTQKKR